MICDADDIAPYLQAVRALDPRPAAGFETDTSGPAQPDVIVLEGDDGGWQAYLNEDSLPSVLVLSAIGRTWRRAKSPMKNANS